MGTCSSFISELHGGLSQQKCINIQQNEPVSDSPDKNFKYFPVVIKIMHPYLYIVYDIIKSFAMKHIQGLHGNVLVSSQTLKSYCRTFTYF